MNEITNEMKVFKVQFPYTVTLDIESDNGLTKLTIETVSEEVVFARNKEDATQQKILSDTVSGNGYINHILNFVRNEITDGDNSSAQIKYTNEPSITIMAEEELLNFQRDVVSLNT